MRTLAQGEGKLSNIANSYVDAWMLFDIENDPFEQTNIAASHPALTATLKAEYDAWNDSCRDSYNGADYGSDDFTPGGFYHENADGKPNDEYVDVPTLP